MQRDSAAVRITSTLETMERAIAMLPGDDISVAKKFYGDGLGFNVAWEASDDGKNGLVGFERGGMELTVDCPMAGHGRQVCVSLRVENADAYYQEWQQRVNVNRAPRNEDWGARTFDLTDPFGNTVFVIGPVTSSSVSFNT
ncbi:MAG: glyoxalase superfamily protein [Gemmatimonadaceae bacterium]